MRVRSRWCRAESRDDRRVEHGDLTVVLSTVELEPCSGLEASSAETADDVSAEAEFTLTFCGDEQPAATSTSGGSSTGDTGSSSDTTGNTSTDTSSDATGGVTSTGASTESG